MKETTIKSDEMLMPNEQSSEVAEPSKGSFDFPSFLVSPHGSPVLIEQVSDSVFASRYDRLDSTQMHVDPKGSTVVCFIGNQSFRPFSRSPWSQSRHFDFVYKRGSQLYFGGRCGGKLASQRNTFAVDHHHPLRSLAAFGFTDALAPFLAGAKLPSTKTSSQANKESASSSAKIWRHILSQISSCSQSRKRRQQVAELGYCEGK